uniref:Uncharacterized protein n=1 Tax=Peronospora matthiolae TaxID=2874970 RepID=A0AAV1TZX5_9STRA
MERRSSTGSSGGADSTIAGAARTAVTTGGDPTSKVTGADSDGDKVDRAVTAASPAFTNDDESEEPKTTGDAATASSWAETSAEVVDGGEGVGKKDPQMVNRITVKIRLQANRLDSDKI